MEIGTVIKWTSKPEWSRLEQKDITPTTYLVKTDTAWEPAGCETYYFDTDEEVIKFAEKEDSIVKWEVISIPLWSSLNDS